MGRIMECEEGKKKNKQGREKVLGDTPQAAVAKTVVGGQTNQASEVSFRFCGSMGMGCCAVYFYVG